MGSFSSKMRSIRDVGSLRKASKGDMNHGMGDERRSVTDPGGTAENTTTTGQADATNGVSETSTAATNQEQLPAPKVDHSFSWLVSSPIVLNTTTKDLNGKGKRPKEGRNTSTILKYNNAKYLKSWQEPTELPSTSTKRKPQNSPSQSCSSSGANNSNLAKYPKKCKSGYEKAEERSAKKGNIGEASTGRSSSLPLVGFGVIEKQNHSSSPRPAVRATHNTTHRSEDKHEEENYQCP